LWEFISPEIKKLKTVKEEPTTTKRGAKNARAKEYLFKTYKAIRWTHRQANLRGRFVSEHSRGLISATHFPSAFDPRKMRLFRTKRKRIDGVRERQKRETVCPQQGGD
jgi:hypothetical protein